MRGAPQEPGHSCPNLDGAIAEIENAREIHEKLRAWGSWWEERAGELEEEMEEMKKEFDKESAEKDSIIRDLENDLATLNKE
jgi:hypothetical protein